MIRLKWTILTGILLSTSMLLIGGCGSNEPDVTPEMRKPRPVVDNPITIDDAPNVMQDDPVDDEPEDG